MTLSQQPSILLTEPTRPLIILDLHGTLCSVVRDSATRRTIGCYIRPKVKQLLEYLHKYYEIAIWSSARPESVEFLSHIFEPYTKDIKLIWTRKDFHLSEQDYRENVLTIKNLDLLWTHITEKKVYPRPYSALNTILLDDSFEKCTLQPHNCAILREFEATDKMYKVYGDNEIDFLIPYLERARHQSNIANWMRQNPYVSVHPAETTALNSFHSIFFTGDKQPAQPTSTSSKKRKTAEPSSEAIEVTAIEKTEATTNGIRRMQFPIVIPSIPVTDAPTAIAATTQAAEYELLFRQVFSQPVSFS